MRSHRFYVDISLTTNQTIELPRDAAHHCVQVLRYQVGDHLTLFNGDGVDYSAVIRAIHKKQVTVEIIGTTAPKNESPLSIHLFQGIARGEKMDWIIQKAVELGVAEITPFFSEFCNVKLDQKRLNKKSEHWQKVVISACEQSGRAMIPKVNSPLTINQLPLDGEQALVLQPDSSKRLSDLKLSNKVSIVIGPEGGFSQSDLTLLESKSAQSVQLGPRILRTETAGVAAIAVLQNLWGDL